MRFSFQSMFCFFAMTICVMAGVAHAQDAGSVGERNPEQAMFLAGWLLYPSVTQATVFNDNINRTDSNKKSGFGYDLNPSFELYRDNGIQKTDIYAVLDAQFYNGELEAQQVQGAFGISHTLKLQPDLSVNVSGGFVRQTGVQAAINPQQATSPLSPLWNALAVSGQEETQWSAAVSVEKTFGEGFLSLSSMVQNDLYDDADLKGQNSVSTSVSAKAGYYIAPAIYAFVQPGVQLRTYQVAGLDAQTYSAVAGVGTDRSATVKGEIYAGFASQHSSSPVAGASQSPVVGMNVTYVPTPSLTFKANIDHNVSISAQTLPTAQTVSTSRAVATGRYMLSPDWFAEGRVGYGLTHYNQDKADDHYVTTGVGLGYDIRRNFDLRLDYQYVNLTSHLTHAGCQQDIYTAGINYHY